MNVQLQNYWPMSNLSDVVGGATLYGSQGYSFVADRFGEPGQAVSFQTGYVQIPPGLNYF